MEIPTENKMEEIVPENTQHCKLCTSPYKLVKFSCKVLYCVLWLLNVTSLIALALTSLASTWTQFTKIFKSGVGTQSPDCNLYEVFATYAPFLALLLIQSHLFVCWENYKKMHPSLWPVPRDRLHHIVQDLEYTIYCTYCSKPYQLVRKSTCKAIYYNVLVFDFAMFFCLILFAPIFVSLVIYHENYVLQQFLVIFLGVIIFIDGNLFSSNNLMIHNQEHDGQFFHQPGDNECMKDIFFYFIDT